MKAETGLAGEEEEEEELPFPVWLEGDSLAPPCQSEPFAIDAMLWDVACVRAEDEVWDVGCGDGRIVMQAMRGERLTGGTGNEEVRERGCRKVVGVEIEEDLVKAFRENVEREQEKAGDDERWQRVHPVHGDLREAGLLESEATVVCMYLLPEALREIQPMMLQWLRKGVEAGRHVRIVCNSWGLPGLTPALKMTVGPLSNVDLLLFDASSLPADTGTTDGSCRTDACESEDGKA